MNDHNDQQEVHARRAVLHWYDFVCPFCYVGQSRTALLVRHGMDVVELPFRAHPDIPPGGIAAGPRSGPIYAMLEREAKEAHLPLNWPPRLPNTLRALAAAEWVRRHERGSFTKLHASLFEAHFVLGENLDDMAVIDRHAGEAGVSLAKLHAGLANGTAEAAVKEAEAIGRKYGVRGTPAWQIGHRLIEGLVPALEFERLACIRPQPDQ